MFDLKIKTWLLFLHNDKLSPLDHYSSISVHPEK